jgi:deoxyribonuclease V
MRIRRLHDWNLSYKQAISLQKKLAQKVQQTPIKSRPKTIAGIDCAFSKDGKRIFSAVIVLQLPGFQVLETANASLKTNFPYIPGLLSFREAPACIAAAEKLVIQPDVFMVDGQGIAHPRRLGIASHLGLFFNKPTIGCAKSRLIGSFTEPSIQKGAFSQLKDRNRLIGAVVRTRTNVKPVFVSVGNKCLLDEAIEIVLYCSVKYRLPEPARLAHQLVTSLKQKA